MFSVTVDNPYTDPQGLQMGTVTILGNVETNGVPDLSVLNPLGSATFGVNVTGPAAPETSTFAMMLAAMLAAGLVLRNHSLLSRARK